MCGIAGIISSNKNMVQQNNLQAMSNALQHRGPDGCGFYINEDNTIGFAHRRLSIIDLSNNADQPFHYLHYTIVYNGEIYNYLEIKKALLQKNYLFTTQSDTEVICAAYDFWGKDCIKYFDGMFAFVICNNLTQELFIARDYFGEKPLYYYVSADKSTFYFASEMKALWSIGIEKKINNLQLLNYLTIGYTSNPTEPTHTFFQNIFQLKANHFIQFNVNDNVKNIVQKKCDDAKYYFDNLNSEQENIEHFKALFSNSINTRLRSDVTVGTSLSGGVDSSSIIAFIHHQHNLGNYKPKTFTSSFPNFEKDETQYSKTVAKHFGLTQHFTTPTEIDFVNEFKNLMYHQEEPLQSASVFSQYMVYKLAKENNITVLLDGQGADEILAGYTKYTQFYLQEILRTNLSLFKKEKALLHTNKFLEQFSIKNYAAAFFPKIAANHLQQKTINQQNINSFINKGFLLNNKNATSLQKPVIKNLQDYLNYSTYHFGLQELLRYADRNSMAHSREVRLPFLQKELVSFIQQLPSSYKIQNGFTKWILRQSVKDKLPHEIVWRKGKIGYEPPQAKWMQNKQLQQMIFEARKKLVDENVLDQSVLQKKIDNKDAHAAHNFDWWCLCAASLFD